MRMRNAQHAVMQHEGRMMLDAQGEIKKGETATGDREFKREI